MTDWNRGDAPPADRRSVLAVVNLSGRKTHVIASYFKEKTIEASIDADYGEYDEEEDVYWCPAGWYADVRFSEFVDFWYEWIEGEVVKWTELPEIPA